MSSLRMYPPSINCWPTWPPVRCSTCCRIGALSPTLSLPSLVTSTPTMARLSVSVANCTFTAGLKPPLGIFITRASASVVLTRGCRARICCAALAVARPARGFGLPLLQLRQLRHGLLQPLQLLGRGPFARRPLPRRQRRMLGRVHLLAQLLHVLPGFFKQLLQPLFAPETARPGADPDPHPVLAHAAYLHHILVHQRRDHLREKLVQRRAVIGAKIRQQAMVHRHPAAQPAERRTVLATPRQLPRRTDAADAGIQPQRHQKLEDRSRPGPPDLHAL